MFKGNRVAFFKCLVISGHFSMERIEEVCCYYIAFLRSVALLHQNHHWITKGKEFYGNHLMFERIYNSALEDIDLIAEKAIGLFNAECLDLNLQANIICKTLAKYNKSDLINSSLKIERDFLNLSKEFYDKCKELDVMTLGLEDALSTISSHREEAAYLLKQAGAGDQINNKIAGRISLLKRISSNK
jgi:DNA-binding ferritin-like protein